MLCENDISVINTESFTIEGGLNGNQLHKLKVSIMKYHDISTNL